MFHQNVWLQVFLRESLEKMLNGVCKKMIGIPNDECTGCAVCTTSCTQNAIKMRQDETTGFLYPYIDEAKCNRCLNCQRICPVLQRRVGSSSITQKDSFYKCYAVKSKSDEIRFASTSGGFFTEIATEILDNEGIVYGVGYSDSMDVLHLHVDNAVELRILQKSKYVQSDMRNVYKDIKKDADSGRLVLFVGCPCQVAAIYSFLGRKYANLYTVEFICMGVNSPLAYRAWIRELESNSRAKVSNIIFKYKRSGWRQSPFLTKVEFNNGHHVVLDESNNSFMRGYLMGGLFVRECCSKCIFNGTNRTADFVIGDHWGADKRIDDDKGTSVVILSTYHSKPLFERIKHRIECVEIDYTDVIRSNPRLTTSVPYNPEQERFYSLLNTCTFSKAVSSVVNKDEPLSDILMNIVFNKDGEK